MPRGGARPGAGRPKGSFEQLVQLRRASEMARLFLPEVPGDGVDFLVSVYKNPDVPVPLRVQCATAAAVYERPRLNATASVTKHIDGDGADFAKLFQQIEQRLALAPPQARGQIIDMLRSAEDDAEERN